jgi:hypothetical protein
MLNDTLYIRCFDEFTDIEGPVTDQRAGASASLGLLHELGALRVLLPELANVDEEFFAALARLEQRTGGVRDGVPQSCLLAVLLWPFVRPVLREHTEPDVEHVVQERIQPLLERFSVARRDSARARQLLAAQWRIAFEPKGRRATRLCRRDFFAEALDLRRIVGPLGDEEDHRAEQWAEWARRHDHAPPGGGRRRRKRRRRGGRKHRSLSAEATKGKDGACPPSASSSAPAPPSTPKASPPGSSSDGSPPA